MAGTTTKPPIEERKATASHLLATEPSLSDRVIGERSGLSRTTVARMRPPPSIPSESRYGRRHTQHLSMVASAARINLDDRRILSALRRLRQAWQDEAWDYYYEVGEINYTVNFDANLKSKLRLYAAVRPESNAAPIPVDSPQSDVDPGVAELCNATLERLRSPQGGQSAIIRDAAINFDVAGECWLHGHEDPDTGEEEWHIRSVSEMIATGEGFGLRRAPNGPLQPVPTDDIVVRMWQRDPRYTDLATCAMRAVLAEAEALLLLSREIRATAKSRLSNGVFLVPSELSFGSADPTRDLGDGEEPEDPFDAELAESMITPIQEEGSAAAVVPMVIRGPAEYLQHVRHLVLDRSLDPALDARIEGRIIRIARGLNMPVEVTTGLMATTFANASQIKQSEFEDHVEPAATLMCDAITAGYFQPALEAAGLDRETWQDIFVWFDAEALIVHPDQAEQATEAHKDGVISDEARRRYVGFTEDDAPTDDEMIRRIIFHTSRMDPFTLSQLMQSSGLAPELMLAMPQNGILGFPATTPPPQVPGLIPGQPQQPPSQPNPPGTPKAPEVEPEPGEPQPGEAGKPEESPKAATASLVLSTPWHPSMTNPSVTYGYQGNGNSTVNALLHVVQAAASPSDPWRRLGVRLMTIDRDLRNRILMSLDRAMRQAIKAAGNRVKSRIQRDKLTGAVNRLAASTKAEGLTAACGPTLVAATGLTDGDLIAGAFDTVLVDIATWMTAAFERALTEVQKLTGPLDPSTHHELTQRHQRNTTLAIEQLQSQMTSLLSLRLYNPTPKASPQGESDATVSIPVSAVRVSLAIAGGGKPRGGRALAGASGAWIDVSGPIEEQDGTPVGGIATGPDVMAQVDQASGGVEGYEWDYGPAIRQPFEPHEALDGVQFLNFDDEVLANDEGWPDTEFFFPGDHEGCCCDITPIILSPQEAEGEVPTGEVPEELVGEVSGYDQAVQDLQDAYDGGYGRVTELTGGAINEGVYRLPFTDGTLGVLKRGGMEDTAVKESLVSRLADAIGASVPAAVEQPDGQLLMRYVNGTIGNDLGTLAYEASTYASPSGSRLGLLDLLIQNEDRNQGNWLMDTATGLVTGIDHEFAFGSSASITRVIEGGQAARYGNFANMFVRSMTGSKVQELVAVETRLERADIKQAFADANHTDWYDRIMGNLSALIEYARTLA